MGISFIVAKNRAIIFNHEIWIRCKVCGEHYDLRMDDKCPNCKTKAF